MDFTDAACTAIEGWTKRHRPDGGGLRWVARTPAQDWGYDQSRWLRDIGEIQRDFERQIGFAIPLTPAEKRKTAELPLLKTLFILVRKAESKSGQTLLKTLLG
ncbi:MAG TPA: hypothetical protein VL100_06395 [Croceibacterium sp.]|nr:hypothetical protein [Croceibacterium sp.]